MRGQGRMTEAENLLRSVLAGQEQRTQATKYAIQVASGKKDRSLDPISLRLFCLAGDQDRELNAKSDLASVIEDQGRFLEAETMLTQVLTARRCEPEPEDADTCAFKKLWFDGQLGASSLADLAMERLLRLWFAQERLADVIRAQGRYDEAKLLLGEVVQAKEYALGKSHIWAISTKNAIGCVLREEGHYAEAELLTKGILACESHGAEHPKTLVLRTNLAKAIEAQGRIEEAQGILQEVSAVREKLILNESAKKAWELRTSQWWQSADMIQN